LSIALGLLHWVYFTGSIALGLLHWVYCTGSIALGLLHWVYCTGSHILTVVIPYYRMYSIFVSHNIFQFQLLTIFVTYSYWRKTPTNCRYMPAEIKMRLNAENVTYHSVRNFLSSDFLPKHIEIKICLTVIFPVSKVCETWSFTIQEDYRLKDIRKYGIKECIWT